MKKINNGETPRQKQLRRREMMKEAIVSIILASVIPMMIIHWIVFGYVH